MSFAQKIKEMDNKVTFVIGYRNLYNIVVMALGFVTIIQVPVGSIMSLPGVIIFILGGKWVIEQIHSNVDAITVSELNG